MKLPRFVKKRNESIVRFKKENITMGLKRTLNQLGGAIDPHLLTNLTERICRNISRRKQKIISVDEIRQAVVKTLRDQKLKDVAGLYDFVFLHIPNPLIKKITKRDGHRVTFHPYRIFKAVNKSFEQVDKHNPRKAEVITREVVKILEKHVTREEKITSEMVKGAVECVLEKHKLPKIAQAYTLHRYF